MDHDRLFKELLTTFFLEFVDLFLPAVGAALGREAAAVPRLPWRRFVAQQNPVASALMAKMKMAPRDRPKVKAECLRLLAGLRLDPARSTLIGGFVDSYLRLTAQEMKQYEREVAGFAPAEREAAMEILTDWHRKGITQGKEAILTRQLRRRFGEVPAAVTARLDQLSSEGLDDLADALLDFQTLADLEQWLARH